MARWYAVEPRLVGSDFIHPMPAGAKIVGELLYESLRDGYNQYKLRQLRSREGGAKAEVKRFVQFWIALLMATTVAVAVQPAKTPKKATSKKSPAQEEIRFEHG